MKEDNDGRGDELGKAEGIAQDRYILQAVHAKHSHHGEGKNPSEIVDEGGCFLLSPENEKGEGAQKEGDCGNDCDQENFVCLIHFGSSRRSIRSIRRLPSERKSVIAIIAGIRKCSLPKMTSESTVHKTPTMAGM